MEQSRIDRINELAKKSREQGLTEQEKEEQKRLRNEYIQGFKRNLTSQLECIYVLDENGEKRKLSKKEK